MKLYEQTEIEIPKLEKACDEEVITTDELEEGYNKMTKENLELQKKMKDIKEKTRIQGGNEERNFKVWVINV